MDEYDRLWAMRAHALSIGDVNFAREIEQKMSSLGFVPGETHLTDTPAQKERAVSHAVPSKRGKK